MSRIEMPQSFSAFGSKALTICAVGESVDLLPADTRPATTSYDLTTQPVGSSAALSGSAFSPDVPGKYVCSVSQGNDTLTIVVWAFSSATFTAIGRRINGETRSDGDKRGLLLGMSRALDDTALATFAAGGWPAGLSADLRQFGG